MEPVPLYGGHQMLHDADVEFAPVKFDVTDQRPVLRLHLRGVEHGARPMSRRVDGQVRFTAWTPVVNERAQSIPVGIASGGLCFADSCITVADADGGVFADRVGELDEAAVLFGDDEVAVHGDRSSS